MKKKFLCGIMAVVACITFAFGFAACEEEGKTPDENQQQTEQTPNEEKPNENQEQQQPEQQEPEQQEPEEQEPEEQEPEEQEPEQQEPEQQEPEQQEPEQQEPEQQEPEEQQPEQQEPEQQEPEQQQPEQQEPEEEDQNYTKGLEYELNSSADGYLVKGIGAATESDIVIPASHEGKPVIGIASSAFSTCNDLKSITIPKGVEKIGGYAFYSCRNLEKISFEENSRLTLIGGCAFSECYSLTGIAIPKSVTFIGNGAFENCNLQRVDITDLTAWCNIQFDILYPPFSANPLYCAHRLFLNGEEITDLKIPESITSIAPGTFIWGVFQSVTIPAHVKEIGTLAFYRCWNEGGIDFIFEENSRLTLIGEYAFKESALTEITIPDSVTKIADFAFEGCRNLTSIIFGENCNLSRIERGAFSECRALEELTIPASVTFLGTSVIGDCSNLKSVKFENKKGWHCGDNDEEIPESYFEEGETALESLRLATAIYLQPNNLNRRE